MLNRIIIITAFCWMVTLPQLSSGSVISLFIEAQKEVIAREEALLQQAQNAVKDKIDQAFDKAHEALMGVAQQVHYYATYPFRAGNDMVEHSMSMLGNATSSVAGYLPFGGSQTNDTALTRDGLKTSMDEASLISRVQRMREQISRLSGLRVVVHTVSENTPDAPVFEIGIGKNGTSANETNIDSQ